MKTIWMINQYGITPDTPGGTRQYEFARAFAKKGHRVSYFLSSFHYQLHKDVTLTPTEKFRVEQRDGINLVWIKVFPYSKNDWRRVYNMFNFAIQCYLLGRQITHLNFGIHPPDIILAFNLPLITPLFAYRLSRRYEAKFFLEVGDLWPQTLIDMGKLQEKSILTVLLRAIERFLYSKAENIVTPIPYASEYFSDVGFPDKGVWIGGGEDLSQYPADICSLPKVNDTFTIMYLGAHGPANDLFTAIKAFKQIQELGYEKIHLILVGDGIEKSALIEEARRTHLTNVTFSDAVPKDQIPQIITGADAFLFLLKQLNIYKYGINLNKMVEYLIGGKPIIFAGEARNNIIKEIGCGLTVLPEDPEALAKAIIQLYQMKPEERAEMGHRGRMYAEAHLNSSIVADRLLRVLGLQ